MSGSGVLTPLGDAKARIHIRLLADGGTGPLAEKSKRKRPGAFSDPAWVAVSPSASRNALCTMCVAVWAREIDMRRSRAASECASSPGVTSPLSTVAWCTIRPLIGDCTSSIRSRAPLESSMSPWSASWPPPSA